MTISQFIKSHAGHGEVLFSTCPECVAEHEAEGCGDRDCTICDPDD